MNDREILLAAHNLGKTYSMGKIRVTALHEVDFAVQEGEFLGVTGTSGSGKSTLMNLLGGLDTPTSGRIEARGKVISEMDPEELARYRRHSVGMIFQSFNLIPAFSAWENVGLPLVFAEVSKRQRRERAEAILKQVGLEERMLHRPRELSGGEQQRVAIARALVNQPEVLLADEPTGNLDSGTSRDIVQLLANLNAAQGLAVVMVSHEEALLREFAHGIVRLRDGKVIKREHIR
ncbi:MAG: ABC transporter ATP-binding protein [Candidatus Aminicenantaceae bacterium]